MVPVAVGNGASSYQQPLARYASRVSACPAQDAIFEYSHLITSTMVSAFSDGGCSLYDRTFLSVPVCADCYHSLRFE
jgi:hypothetical protein